MTDHRGSTGRCAARNDQDRRNAHTSKSWLDYITCATVALIIAPGIIDPSPSFILPGPNLVGVPQGNLWVPQGPGQSFIGQMVGDLTLDRVSSRERDGSAHRSRPVQWYC